MQFISQNMQFERGTIIKKIYEKFFKGKPFGKDESKKLAELSGVYSVKIDTSSGKLLECNWFNGTIDYNNIKQPQITKEELSNPDIKSLDDLYSFRKQKEEKEKNKKLEESKKKSEEKKSEESVKEEEKPEIKETVKPEEPKKEVITVPPDNKEEQPLLIDTSGLLDKWSKKSIDQFNDDLNTIKQDEKIKANKLSADNFNNLKLVGIKGKIDENIKFVLVNVKSNIIFEVFKTKKYDKDKNENNIDIQISTFLDVFDYKATLYKRQSEARRKPSKKERDEYLNQYCYVDFKLLPREEKLA